MDEIHWCAFNRHTVDLDEIIMGFLREQDRSLKCGLNRAVVHPWFGAGREGHLQALQVMNRRYGSLVGSRFDA